MTSVTWVAGAAVLFCRLRRPRINTMTTAKRPITARPPISPPTIGPTGVGVGKGADEVVCFEDEMLEEVLGVEAGAWSIQ